MEELHLWADALFKAQEAASLRNRRCSVFFFAASLPILVSGWSWPWMVLGHIFLFLSYYYFIEREVALHPARWLLVAICCLGPSALGTYMMEGRWNDFEGAPFIPFLLAALAIHVAFKLPAPMQAWDIPIFLLLYQGALALKPWSTSISAALATFFIHVLLGSFYYPFGVRNKAAVCIIVGSMLLASTEYIPVLTIAIGIRARINHEQLNIARIFPIF